MNVACQYCGRSHRGNEAVEKCKVRAAKKEEAAERKRLDGARRLHNQATKPPAEICVEVQRAPYRNGKLGEPRSLFLAVARLNKDYPPPEGKKEWTIVDVVMLDNERLNWPF